MTGDRVGPLNGPRRGVVETGCLRRSPGPAQSVFVGRPGRWSGIENLARRGIGLSRDFVMATITKKELIDRIAERDGYKRALVKRVVQSFLDSIIQELSDGNRIEFRDFGVFESRIRASRDAQNPKTMDKVHVPSKRTVKFKIGRVLKARLHETPPALDAATGLPVEASAPKARKSASMKDGAVLRRKTLP